jgi:adenosylhomocysteine nucleosidase
VSEPAPLLLLSALDVEGAPLADALTGARREPAAGLDFRRGTLGRENVVFAMTGVGKVAAAHATAAAIERFRPRACVVFGAAGALDSRVHVGDFVLATTLVQHDLGVRALRRASADEALRAELGDFVRGRPGARVHEGTVLTGDKACLSLRRRLWLRYAFRRDAPIAVDMESAAVASVCNRAALPVAVLRIATDRAGPLALIEFHRNAASLAPEPARVLLEWLRLRNR